MLGVTTWEFIGYGFGFGDGFDVADFLCTYSTYEDGVGVGCCDVNFDFSVVAFFGVTCHGEIKNWCFGVDEVFHYPAALPAVICTACHCTAATTLAPPIVNAPTVKLAAEVVSI